MSFWAIAYYFGGFIYLIQWLLVLFDYYHPSQTRVTTTTFAAMTILLIHIGTVQFKEWKRGIK